MGRERLATGPVEALRKKQKQKDRKRCAAQRAEKQEQSLVRRSEHDVQKTMDGLRGKNAREMIGHYEKGKLERMEKLLKKHGDKLEERWQKQSVLDEKKAHQQRVESMADVAVFSVYFDRDTNPYGVPPPGKPPSFRHPDGTTKPHPPFLVSSVPEKRNRSHGSDSEVEVEVDTPQPSCAAPEISGSCAAVLPPGFSFNPISKFQLDANRLHSERTPYRPPLPQAPPPLKNQPPPPKDPPPKDLLERRETPSFDDVLAMAKRQAAEAKIPTSAPEVTRAAEVKTPAKATSFVPTVLRTKQARVHHIGEQASALSLAVGSENTRSSKSKKESKDLDAAFDSFMKEV